MSGIKILHWPYGYNARRVDGWVASVVVSFDMLKTHGFCYAWHLVKLTHVATNRRVISQRLTVGFKVPKVHRIETNQGGE